MVQYRSVQPDCFSCGTQFPKDINLYDDGTGYYEYNCAKCGARIAQGIVAENGGFAETPYGVRGEDILLPFEGDWGVAEHWWTDRMYLSLIHGVPVDGDEVFHDFLKQLWNLHDYRS